MTTALAAIPFDRAKILQAVATISAETSPLLAYLRMDKFGEWSYGTEALEIPEDTLIAINPGGFAHGYVAWGEGEKLGEHMVSIYNPLPETGPVPGGCEHGWQAQHGMTLRVISGPANGTQLAYYTSSHGGRKAVAGVLQALGQRISADPNVREVVPVVKISSTSYPHKKFGKIYTPVFKITKWMNLPEDGAPAGKTKAKSKAKK